MSTEVSAICIFCGSQKRGPFKKCQACRRGPSTDYLERAKSFYLSTQNVDDDGKQLLTNDELLDAGCKIRSGANFMWPRAEIDRLQEQQRLVEGCYSGRINLFLIAAWIVVLALWALPIRCVARALF